jgi:hypothetical protein
MMLFGRPLCSGIPLLGGAAFAVIATTIQARVQSAGAVAAAKNTVVAIASTATTRATPTAPKIGSVAVAAQIVTMPTDAAASKIGAGALAAAARARQSAAGAKTVAMDVEAGLFVSAAIDTAHLSTVRHEYVRWNSYLTQEVAKAGVVVQTMNLNSTLNLE